MHAKYINVTATHSVQLSSTH